MSNLARTLSVLVQSSNHLAVQNDIEVVMYPLVALYHIYMYKSKGIELFLQGTFVYWMKMINFQKYFFALFICI
jgi:hypothetical protein